MIFLEEDLASDETNQKEEYKPPYSDEELEAMNEQAQRAQDEAKASGEKESSEDSQNENLLSQSLDVGQICAKGVVTGGICMCSMGIGPLLLNFQGLPKNFETEIGNLKFGTIAEIAPMKNIIPTGTMCSTMSNPTVAAATAAKLGILTPVPCTPLITAPWMAPQPLTSTIISNLHTCQCAWGGTIKIITTGQITSKVYITLKPS